MSKKILALVTAIGMIFCCIAASAESWICENCSTENTGNFCGNCGARKPEPAPEPEPQSPDWVCPDCLNINTTNFCSNCGRKRPTDTSARSIIIEETEYGIMDVDGVFVGETISIPEEPAVTYMGSLSEKHEEDSYTYTAPRNGRYRFDLTDVMANASLRLRVWDSKNKCMIDTYSAGSSEVLKAGETYKIQVQRRKGSTDYTLKIGVQKPSTDISGATTIYDQVSFEDQNNVYMFTAPIEGRYRFNLTEAKESTRFRLMVWDKFDKSILDTYSKGSYVILEAGETYQIQVRQHKNLGSYTMLVYFQKETRDITGYSTVNDSIEFEDQKNVYLFCPPIDGRYRFDLTETNENNRYRLMIWDKFDKNILDTYSKGAYVSLTGGETYQLQVRQHKGTGTYSMVIGYQKEPVDISDADAVYDRITFDDQKNIYFYTPSQTGEYEIALSDYNSTYSFRLMAWDKYDKLIMDHYGKGTVTLEADEKYQIQVRQNKGHDSYCLSVSMK